MAPKRKAAYVAPPLEEEEEITFDSFTFITPPHFLEQMKATHKFDPKISYWVIPRYMHDWTDDELYNEKKLLALLLKSWGYLMNLGWSIRPLVHFNPKEIHSLIW